LRRIAILFYSASTKIIVNGVAGRSFAHARGLRQAIRYHRCSLC
jgi:hypothetical protein